LILPENLFAAISFPRIKFETSRDHATKFN
jgi:hypothetical protein